MKKTALALVLSLILFEWLDFTLYLYLAKSIFSQQFFPVSENSLMLTFAVFAVGYIARPLGGWIFGSQADLNGRRKPMVASSLLMGLATLGICLLPGYAHIGIWSTWGLLLLRLAQGLALGGEMNTSAMFLIEHYRHKPLLTGAFVAASSALGMFVGAGIAAYIQTIPIPSLWRYVFAMVGCLSLWICYQRKALVESPEFDNKQRFSAYGLWRHYYRGLLNIAVVAIYVSVMVYLCNVYWLAYAMSEKLWSPAYCTWLGAWAQFFSAMAALPIAWITPAKYGHILLRVSMLLTMVVAPFLFYVTAMHAHVLVFVALGGYILANGLLCASLFYFLYQQLPAQYRCRGVSTIWGIAASCGSLTLPIVQYVVNKHAFYMLPSLIVSTASLIAYVVTKVNQNKPERSIYPHQITEFITT